MVSWLALCALVAACIVAVASAVPDIMAQTPANVTFHIITDRGNLFEIEPADRTPTTDVVSSPYIEFQRAGGVVVSGGMVREAAQYNEVGASTTYVISDWSEGKTYGIPNGAPLGGELRMSPLPHLYMRTPQELVPGSGTYLPLGISHVEVMAGNVAYANRTHGTYGDYYEFRGAGRAIIWLDPANPLYAINMVCSGCATDTPAVVGAIDDDGGGNPTSHKMGSGRPISPTMSAPCTVSGVNHMGCGNTHTGKTTSAWPLEFRRDLRNSTGDDPEPIQIAPILNITRYDTTACPGANSTNTIMEPLNGTLFRVTSHGCVMENYTYEWWDGIIELEESLPLRPGLSIWEGPSGHHPAIILNNMGGGEILLQAYAAPNNHTANTAYHNTLTVNAGHLVTSDSIVILHDSFAHLGAYTLPTLRDMVNHIHTHPQLLPEPSMVRVSHSTSASQGEFGGLLGADCKAGYQYCITVFDGRNMPAIHNAAGVVYDPRNGAEINRGTDVDNWSSVFTATPTTPPVPYTIPYDATKLNLVQAYAVIPVSGHIRVEELYIMAGRDGARGCDRYVDTTADPHRWAAPSAPGWMRLEYLEGEYGDGNTRINIPLLQWYDVVCMKTHGRDEFRQFNMNNFFVVGEHASLGGTKHIMTYHDAQHTTRPTYHIETLNTDIILPGSGVRVMDLDVDVDVSVIVSGVVEGGGAPALAPPLTSPSTGQMRSMCDWEANSSPQWNTTSRAVGPSNPAVAHVRINVEIQAPVAGGGYQTVGVLGGIGTAIMGASDGHLPMTVGTDCMERVSVSWDFDPRFHTIPLEYQSNTPMNISVETQVWFTSSTNPQFAGQLADETIHVETFIDRLSVRMH